MGAGRPPKCKICGKRLSVETAYMVITYNSKGTPKKSFYCSKIEYENGKEEIYEEPIQKEKPLSNKERVLQALCRIIGREKIINSILPKEWTTWNELASDDIIAQYLEENTDFLCGVVEKLDDIEYKRIRYLSAIIKNSIGDYKAKFKLNNSHTISQDEHYPTRKYKRKDRVALEDLEEACCE